MDVPGWYAPPGEPVRKDGRVSEEECTARLPNGTYGDPESCECEDCLAWKHAQAEAWAIGPELANPDF